MKQKILLALGCILLASGAWATNYTLTLYADGCSSPNTFICPSGQQLSVNATPMEHRHFVKWNDGITDNPRLVTMNQNLTYTATFVPDSFHLAVLSSDTICGLALGSGDYPYNTTVEISAEPNYGYHFSYWLYHGNTYSFNQATLTIEDNDTIVAVFRPNTYRARISCSSNRGSIYFDNSSYPSASDYKDYTYLQSSQISAIPKYGYHFDSWNDGNTENPRTFVITQDTAFVAFFAPETFHVSLHCDSVQGVVSNDTLLPYLANHSIEATANYGYHFSYWSDGNTTNPRTIQVAADTSYTAYFERNIYTMSASGEHGHVEGIGSYPYESLVTLTAIPDFGYLFHHWSDGSEENPRVDTLLGDSTLMAYFVLQYEGICGDNLTWQYDTKMLTISGTGDMYDFSSTNMPWILLRDSIENVVIEHGVTSIGDYAFYGCQNRAFTKLSMPQSVKKIGHDAFADCNRLTSVVFSSDMEEVGDYAFSGCTRINDMTCYATVTPDAAEHTFDGVNTMAYLYVQAGSARTYKLDPYWGVFDIHEIGADSTVISNNQVQVVPADNEAVFTWPMAENADTYSLSITKDGEVFCTLTFNANGQLIGLAFAPSLDGSANAPAATTSIAGMSFTVTGLDGASKYVYRLAAKDATNEEIVAYSGEFATSGYEGEVIPGGNPENETALDNISASVKAEKQIIDGVLYIIRDGVRYTATGQRAE